MTLSPEHFRGRLAQRREKVRVHHWPAHQGLIWGITFSPDGRRFLSTGLDRTARLWDVATGRALQLFEPDVEEILCGAISPDGRDAVCDCADGVIRLWKLPR